MKTFDNRVMPGLERAGFASVGLLAGGLAIVLRPTRAAAFRRRIQRLFGRAGDAGIDAAMDEGAWGPFAAPRPPRSGR